MSSGSAWSTIVSASVDALSSLSVSSRDGRRLCALTQLGEPLGRYAGRAATSEADAAGHAAGV
jgi:hypothetical protein